MTEERKHQGFRSSKDNMKFNIHKALSPYRTNVFPMMKSPCISLLMRTKCTPKEIWSTFIFILVVGENDHIELSSVSVKEMSMS